MVRYNDYVDELKSKSPFGESWSRIKIEGKL
jgi:hypothetical protein